MTKLRNLPSILYAGLIYGFIFLPVLVLVLFFLSGVPRAGATL